MHYEIQRFYDDRFNVSNITYNGEPVWLARDVGAQMGYHDRGRRFVSNVSGKWASKLIDGKDVIRVEGEDAQSIMHAFAIPAAGIAKTRSAILLTRSGVEMCCLLTRKPIGDILRRWLVDVVFPALRRGEAIGGPAKLTPKEMTAKRLLMRERRQVLDAARRAGVRGHELHEMANIMVRDAFGFELSDPSEVQIPLGFTEAAKLRRIVDHAEAQGTVQPSAAAELRKALGSRQ